MPTKPRTKPSGTSKPSGSDVRAKKKLVRPHAHTRTGTRRRPPPRSPGPPPPGATHTRTRRAARGLLRGQHCHCGWHGGLAGLAAPLEIAPRLPPPLRLPRDCLEMIASRWRLALHLALRPRPPPEGLAAPRSRRVVVTSLFVWRACAVLSSSPCRPAPRALRSAHAPETLCGSVALRRGPCA